MAMTSVRARFRRNWRVWLMVVASVLAVLGFALIFALGHPVLGRLPLYVGACGPLLWIFSSKVEG